MLHFLLARGAQIDNSRFSVGKLVNSAAGSNHVAMMEALIKAGATLRLDSAMVSAAYGGAFRAMSWLLDQGASIDALPNLEHYSDIQVEYGVKNPLCMAASQNDPDTVQWLLKRGANPLIKNTAGKTALDLAKEDGPECVAILQKVTNDML